MSRYLESSAYISPDGLYRWWLSRRLGTGDRTVLFVGLNPSTADGREDDPTIRREVGFAVEWGFDWLLKGNLYAFRSTDPRGLLTAADPVGAGNQDELKWMAFKAELIVAAWGSNPLTPAAAALAKWILSLDHTRCLGVNKNGSPKHPLYLPKTAVLQIIK